MGGGGKDIVQKTEPPAYVQPFLQDVLGQARQTNREFTPQYFPQNTVAPVSPYTQGAVAQLASLGGSPANQNITGNAMQGLSTLANGTMTSRAGLLTAPNTLSTINQTQQRAGNAGPDLGPVNSQGSSFEQAGSQIGFASGLNEAIGRGPGSNPYVDELVNRTMGANTRSFQQNTIPQLQNSTQYAGGFGGSRQGVMEGIATQGLSDANADAAARIYSSAYESDAARQLQALGMGAQVAQSAGAMGLERTAQDRGYGLNLGLAGENVAANRVNQALSAAGLGTSLLTTGGDQDLRGAQAAAVTAPGVQSMLQFGPQTLGQAGQMDFGYRQALLDDAINRYNFAQQQPYESQNQYLSAVYGLPSLGGSQQTQSGAGGSALAGAAGGAIAGAGLAASTGAFSGALGGAAGLSNPYGWAMIAGMALLGGLSN